MSNSGSVIPAAAQSFMTYVTHRRTLMVIGGGVAIAAGVVGIVVFGGGSSSVWFGGLAFLGLGLALGSRAGASMVKDMKSVTTGSPAKMELTTYADRTTGRALVNNRVRVTLDIPGNVQRLPAAEFRAVWYTPGTAERPTRLADVFGTLDDGQTVLAVAEDGSCYLGRVKARH